MLGARLLVSAVLIPSLIGLLYVDAKIGPSAPILYALCVLIGLRCLWELVGLLKRENIDARFGSLAICLMLLLTSVWARAWLSITGEGFDAAVIRVPPLSLTFAACVLLLMTIRAVRFREAGIHLPSLGAEVFAVAYIGLLLSITAELRWWGPPDRQGYVLLGLLIVATKLGDVGAYTLGRMFGRRRMSPYLSPGKTWMGASGAVLGGVLGGFLWLTCFAPLLGPPVERSMLLWGSALGGILAIAGLVGDLCESLIKRDAGVKDAAALMPGFGGLLDLVDSILFAGPVAVLLCRLFAG